MHRQEKLFVQYWIQKRNLLTLIDLFEDVDMWIGLYDRDDDNVYRYISTGSLTYIYDLWAKDQPSGRPNVVTQAKKNGKWSSVYGILHKLYSVCEKL